jgi:hypothetical protein
MVPYILYRIRTLIQEEKNFPNFTQQAANLLQKMGNTFELHQGSESQVCIAKECLTEGPN